MRGKPVPIEHLKIYRTLTHDQWLDLLKAIPEGHAQEVAFSRSACQRHVKSLEEAGEIEKGKFQVIQRGDPTDPEVRRVFIANIG